LDTLTGVAAEGVGVSSQAMRIPGFRSYSPLLEFGE
jgi:hypothetical protein